MSDTHGHIDLMNEVAYIMKEMGANTIIHLGDDMYESKDISVPESHIIAVPGIYEDLYNDKNIPNRRIEQFGKINFMLSHTPAKDGHDLPSDPDPEFALKNNDVQVLLHGHTHVFGVEKYEKGYKINPGHLKPNDNRGNPPTFAILEIEKNNLDVKIYDLSGNILLEKKLKL